MSILSDSPTMRHDRQLAFRPPNQSFLLLAKQMPSADQENGAVYILWEEFCIEEGLSTTCSRQGTDPPGTQVLLKS